ncbi:hypothetical protein ALC57_16675 [Trachymyrmex cornetzi]|uniref:Uncharacterized protein n=1 Tax=Trachymyrmex cornetzi TaxID=471704 RepID=A0A195DE63_9HYME|nr:hypothetical protein ALC57_16675 [Trachymyrmex cornetzi]
MASLKYVVVFSLLMMMLAHCYAKHEHEHENHPEQPSSDNAEPIAPSSDDEINSKTDEPQIEPKILYASKILNAYKIKK